jgi:2-methylisocitrate lyase-like PEP mutase family enzyme
MTQKERAAQLRQLHQRRPLVLPNAWDAVSARLIERAGAAAIATTSAAVAWALGRPDGWLDHRDAVLGVVRNIVRVVDVPVTADVEGGYGSGSLQDVEETVRGVVAAGGAGINLEDSPGERGERLLSPEAHAARLKAARKAATGAGGDLVINARVDVFLRGEDGVRSDRIAEAIRRANAYLAAGADCAFVPGVSDELEIHDLVKEVRGPLNVMAGPGSPDIHHLGALGVARVSLGPGAALVALTALDRSVRDVLEHGRYKSLEETLSFRDVDALF